MFIFLIEHKIDILACYIYWQDKSSAFFLKIANDPEFAKAECKKIAKSDMKKLDCMKLMSLLTPSLYETNKYNYAAAINKSTDQKGHYTIIETFCKQ